jgi:hypothetical protein
LFESNRPAGARKGDHVLLPRVNEGAVCHSETIDRLSSTPPPSCKVASTQSPPREGCYTWYHTRVLQRPPSTAACCVASACNDSHPDETASHDLVPSDPDGV